MPRDPALNTRKLRGAYLALAALNFLLVFPKLAAYFSPKSTPGQVLSMLRTGHIRIFPMQEQGSTNLCKQVYVEVGQF
jgi:hypothetical protein